MTQPDLEALEAEYERLWLAYNHLQRNLPQCEHIREWQRQTEAAGKAYRAALRTLDAAIAETEAPPASVPSSLPAEPEPAAAPSGQEALFEITPERAA